MGENIKLRPYWHVDLKWIFGILTAFLLSIFLLLFTIGTLTSEKTAIPLAAQIVAMQFSKNGLDDVKDVEILKSKYLSTNHDTFYPLQGQDVSITRSDLQTLSPRELRLKIFRQIVEPFYYEKIDEKTKKQAGILAFINQTTHKIIDQITIISFILFVLSLTGLIFFSYQYGKLISPAVVFLFVSTLPSAFLFIIAHARSNKENSGPIPFLPNDIAQELAKTLAAPYNFIFFTGIGLLVAVFVIKLLKKFSR